MSRVRGFADGWSCREGCSPPTGPAKSNRTIAVEGKQLRMRGFTSDGRIIAFPVKIVKVIRGPAGRVFQGVLA